MTQSVAGRRPERVSREPRGAARRAVPTRPVDGVGELQDGVRGPDAGGGAARRRLRARRRMLLDARRMVRVPRPRGRRRLSRAAGRRRARGLRDGRRARGRSGRVGAPRGVGFRAAHGRPADGELVRLSSRRRRRGRGKNINFLGGGVFSE